MTRRHAFSSIWLFVFVSWLGACGDDGASGATDPAGSGGSGSVGGTSFGGATLLSTEVPSDATEFEACRYYLNASCERLIACDSFYASTCYDRLDLCPSRLFADGSQWTIELAYSCAAAWANLSCEEALNGKSPTCAPTAGTRADGDFCFVGVQCISGQCSSMPFSGFDYNCGECLPLAASHGTCSSSIHCPVGETCKYPTSDATEGTCADLGAVPTTTFVPVGGQCGRYGPRCASALVCQIELVADEVNEPDVGVCAVPAALGAACTPTFGSMGACEMGSSCDSRPTGTCVTQPGIGDSCGYTTCTDDSFCNFDATYGTTYTCHPKTAAGQACERTARFGRESTRCAGGLECLCLSEGCVAAVCATPRAEGESCNQSTEICRQGYSCVSGSCQPLAERDLAVAIENSCQG